MATAAKPRQPRLRASCDGCFLAKVKCSKARPICSRCLACGLECRYSPSSRAGKPKSDHSNVNNNVNGNMNSNMNGNMNGNIASNLGHLGSNSSGLLIHGGRGMIHGGGGSSSTGNGLDHMGSHYLLQQPQHQQQQHPHQHQQNVSLQAMAASTAASAVPGLSSPMSDDQNLMYAATSASTVVSSSGMYGLDAGWQTPCSMEGNRTLTRNQSMSSEIGVLSMDDAAQHCSGAVSDFAAHGSDFYAARLPWTPPTDFSATQFPDSASTLGMHHLSGGTHSRSHSYDFSVPAAPGAGPGPAHVPWLDTSMVDFISYHSQSALHTPVSMDSASNATTHTHSNGNGAYIPSPATTPSLRQSPTSGHDTVPLASTVAMAGPAHAMTGSNSNSNNAAILPGTTHHGGSSGGSHGRSNSSSSNGNSSGNSNSNSNDNSNSSGNGHPRHRRSRSDCMCFSNCLSSLQALHNASSPASSFEYLLTLNSKAVEGCSAMLGCPRCMNRSGTHTAAMLLATLLGKITSFYKAASQLYFDENGLVLGAGAYPSSLSMSSLTSLSSMTSLSSANSSSFGFTQSAEAADVAAAASSTTAAMASSGSASAALAPTGLGVSLGATQVLNLHKELRKLEEVYARFRQVCGDLSEDMEMSNAIISYLGHMLGSTLELVNHRKGSMGSMGGMGYGYA